MGDVRDQGWEHISIIAVGNKADLKEQRAVNFLEASRFAQENSIMFFETSALTGEGVHEVFAMLAQRVLQTIQEGKADPSLHPRWHCAQRRAVVQRAFLGATGRS